LFREGEDVYDFAKIWNYNTGEIQTLRCYEGFQINKNQILCMGYYGSIEKWDFIEKYPLDLLRENRCSRNLIKLNKSLYAFSSFRGSRGIVLKGIFNKKFEEIIKINAYIDDYYFIKLRDSLIAVCIHKTSQIEIWNYESLTKIKTISADITQINCVITLNDTKMAIGCKDNCIQIFDYESGICIKTLTGHIKPISCLLKLNDTQLASASKDNSIIIWDF